MSSAINRDLSCIIYTADAVRVGQCISLQALQRLALSRAARPFDCIVSDE